MAAQFGSFHASFKAVRAKTLPEGPSDGAKACRKLRIVSTKKTLFPILPSVAELPKKLPRPKEAFQHAEPLSFGDAIALSVQIDD